MDIELVKFMFLLTIISFYVNLALSIYGVVAKSNLVKKIIALTILQDSVNIFAILVGYRLWRPGLTLQPPVLTDLTPTSEAINEFVRKSVDPLPQALVLTAIVIGLAVTVFLATITLHIQKHFGVVDVDVIGRLKREELRGEVV